MVSDDVLGFDFRCLRVWWQHYKVLKKIRDDITLVRERADAEAFTHTDISRFVCSLSYTSASYQLYSLAWLTNTHASSCQ